MKTPDNATQGPFPAYHYVFVTLPQYSMIALSSAIEALRMANRISQQNVYQWTLASLGGQPVAASNGLTLSPTVALEDIGQADIVFVCGGIDIEAACTAPLVAALRKIGQRNVALGSYHRLPIERKAEA